VIAQVPVAPLPAHGGRIQRRQEHCPRRSGGNRVDVVGKDEAGLALEVDLDHAEGRYRRALCQLHHVGGRRLGRKMVPAGQPGPAFAHGNHAHDPILPATDGEGR
jgi:hypothetical protein